MMFNALLAAFPGFFTRGRVPGNHRKPGCRGGFSREAQGRHRAVVERLSSSLMAVIPGHRRHRRRGRRHRFASFGTRITPI